MYALLILLIIILIPIPIMSKYMLGRQSAYQGVFEGIISAIIGVTMVFMFSQVMTGITIFDRFDAILINVNAADMNMPGMYKMLGLNKLNASELQTAMDNMKEIMKLSIPGTIIIWSSIFAYFNYKIVSWLLHKSGKEVSMLPPFRNFSLPKSVMLGSVLIFVFSYFAANMGIIDKSLIMFNIQMVFSFIYFVQGLAVLFYSGNMKRVPKVILIIIAAAIISTAIGKTALFILGLTDVAFDIRKRIFPKQA